MDDRIYHLSIIMSGEHFDPYHFEDKYQIYFDSKVRKGELNKVTKRNYSIGFAILSYSPKGTLDFPDQHFKWLFEHINTYKNLYIENGVDEFEVNYTLYFNSSCALGFSVEDLEFFAKNKIAFTVDCYHTSSKDLKKKINEMIKN